MGGGVGWRMWVPLGGHMSNRLRPCCVAVLALSACSVVRATPSLSGQTKDQNLLANNYCKDVASDLADRRNLQRARVASGVALVALGIAATGGTAAFALESDEDSPSDSSLTFRGGVAITSSILGAVAGTLFAYTSKEIDARRSAGAEVSKIRALANASQNVFDSTEQARLTAEEKQVPQKVLDSCEQIALDNEKRGQAATDQMIQEIGKRYQEARDNADAAKRSEAEQRKRAEENLALFRTYALQCAATPSDCATGGALKQLFAP